MLCGVLLHTFFYQGDVIKTIKVLLGSSIVEFEDERVELGDFVRSLNDYYEVLP